MIPDWIIWLVLIEGIFLLFGLLIVGLYVWRLDHAFGEWTRTLFSLERRYEEREK